MARKILLADDSVTAQNMGRKILADAGYEVVTVNNGSAALKRIAESKPDLVVLDVYMPGYSGLEVCQRLKDAGETAHIPVLLTVGKLEPFKPEEARRVRADAHIVKPFEASELLTAITRLEDRMVPPQSEGSRFGTEGSGRRSDNNPGADTGWKSRLGFPSKKKKEEPEDVTAGGSFRDFRKGKSKTGAAEAFSVKAAPGEGPGPVAELPRDITPEELDALSAVAAKLDGAIPASENAAPFGDSTTTVPVEVATAEVAAAKAGMEDFAAEAGATKEKKTEVEAPAAVVDPAATAVEAPAFAVKGRGEIEIPVEHLEAAAEGAAGVGAEVSANPVLVEIDQPGTECPAGQNSATQNFENQNFENQHPEASAAAVAVAVNTAAFVQESAPVDSSDEPMFASISASTLASAAGGVVPAEEKTETRLAEAFARIEAAEAGGLVEAVAAKDLGPQPESLQAQDSNAEELPAEKAAQPVPVAATEAEEPAPSDEELAQALRLLTPASGPAEVSHGTLVAAGPRWVAEPVSLSREEAAILLEAEMFGTFAVLRAAAPGGEIEPVRITGVSAITATVESRLAAAEFAASAKTLPEQGAEDLSAAYGSAGHGSETTSAATSVVAASAEAMAAVSNVASPVVEGNGAGKLEAEQKDSPAKVSQEVPEEASAEEAAAATFADGFDQDEVEATAEPDEVAVCGTTGAVAQAVAEVGNQDSSSQIEGQESMRKDVKSKSNRHQVRTAQASADTGRDAEETAETAKAKAAAAGSSSSGTLSSSAADASTIASIVDSVMADLRPKIVEEIAKRLAGK